MDFKVSATRDKIDISDLSLDAAHMRDGRTFNHSFKRFTLKLTKKQEQKMKIKMNKIFFILLTKTHGQSLGLEF